MTYKKVKQILAVIGLVIIAGLYITTLVLALVGNENTNGLFMASILCTILVPVLMYIFSWVYKLVKGDAEEARRALAEAEAEDEAGDAGEVTAERDNEAEAGDAGEVTAVGSNEAEAEDLVEPTDEAEA